MAALKLVHDLEQFSLKSMTECGVALRKAGAGKASMKEVAEQTLEYLCSTLTFADRADGACALARFFITQRFSGLPIELRKKLHSRQTELDPNPLCLLLLTSRAFKADSKEVRSSRHPRVLILPPSDPITEFPMLAGVNTQLDVPVENVQAHAVFISEANNDGYCAFYLPDVLSSSSIPAQDEFVIPNGVRSVVGYGGQLPSGCQFGVALFLRVAISRQVALAFRPFALNTKIALLPFDQPNLILRLEKGSDARRN